MVPSRFRHLVFAKPLLFVKHCINACTLLYDTDLLLGLQCHTAPFSWKVVFENNHQLFELTMSACSLNEEVQWRKNLAAHVCKSSIDTAEEASIGTLALNIRPMGTVFGKPGKRKSLSKPVESTISLYLFVLTHWPQALSLDECPFIEPQR